MEEVNYVETFSVQCEKNVIFNNIFPYWKIPGTSYPDVTERNCVNALECSEKPFSWDGVANTFDHINFVVGDVFHYYCEMDNLRGRKKSMKRLNAIV